MKKITAVVTVVVATLLCGLLSSCQNRLEGSFAYVDEKGRVALYDMSARKETWQSGLRVPSQSAPAWSPDGKTLAYVCKDPVQGKSFLALLGAGSSKETLVELKDSPAAWAFDIGTSIAWFPSSLFLSIEDEGYSPCPIIIVDVPQGKGVAR